MWPAADVGVSDRYWRCIGTDEEADVATWGRCDMSLELPREGALV